MRLGKFNNEELIDWRARAEKVEAERDDLRAKLAAAEAKGWRGVNGRIKAERDAALASFEDAARLAEERLAAFQGAMALAERLGKSVAALLNNPDGAIRHKGETYSARDWARAALAEWEARLADWKRWYGDDDVSGPDPLQQRDAALALAERLGEAIQHLFDTRFGGPGAKHTAEEQARAALAEWEARRGTR